jgi:peptidoglycan hydrolase-like protein with peptidoglycan-binding domain
MRLLVIAFLAMATAISVNALYFQEETRLAASSVGSGTSKPQQRSAPAKPAPALPSVTAALPDKPAPSDKPAAALSDKPTAALSDKPAVTPFGKPAATPSDKPMAALSDKPAPTRAEPQPDTPAPQPAKPAEQPTPLVRSIQKKLARLGYPAMPQDGLASPETRAAILAVEFEQGRPLSGEPADSVLSTLYFLEASGRARLASSDSFERDRKLVQEVQDLLAKLGYASGPIDGQLDGKTRDAIRRFETDRRLKAEGRLTERVILEMVIERGKPFLSKG